MPTVYTRLRSSSIADIVIIVLYFFEGNCAIICHIVANVPLFKETIGDELVDFVVFYKEYFSTFETLEDSLFFHCSSFLLCTFFELNREVESRTLTDGAF